ncbi:MAG TPA: hypothetical protein VE734_07465 [Terriglobales bacterium]|nr:hypothetical protein [Terriglobales bacterium]
MAERLLAVNAGTIRPVFLLTGSGEYSSQQDEPPNSPPSMTFSALTRS